MVKEIRGRSGAGSVPVHGLAPQNLSPDTHVDVCADSDEDRGSTPLASTFALRAKVSAVALAKAGQLRSRCANAARLRLGRPASNASVHLRVYFAKRKRPETFLHWPHGRSSPATDSSQCRQSPTHSKMETLAHQNYIAFSDPNRAVEFEQYLKSASGRAFVKKRL